MINIEFNHVACPGFEPGRLSRKGSCSYNIYSTIPTIKYFLLNIKVWHHWGRIDTPF